MAWVMTDDDGGNDLATSIRGSVMERKAGPTVEHESVAVDNNKTDVKPSTAEHVNNEAPMTLEAVLADDAKPDDDGAYDDEMDDVVVNQNVENGNRFSEANTMLKPVTMFLMISSTDGYVSRITFDAGELGTPLPLSGASLYALMSITSRLSSWRHK